MHLNQTLSLTTIQSGLWSRMFSAGVRVGFQNCWSRSRESVFQNCWSRSRFFKTARVGVGFSKLLESESVFQNCWSRSRFFKTAGVGVRTFVAITDSNVY